MIKVFHNTLIGSRRDRIQYGAKLFIFCFVLLIILISVKVLLRQSAENKNGAPLFSYGLALTSFLCIIGIIYSAFSARIVLSVGIDIEKNLVSVKYIEKFERKVRTLKSSLLNTQIQISSKKFSRFAKGFAGKTFVTIHITNEVFGTLAISDQEFKDDEDLAKYFESLRYHIAGQIRKKH